MPLEPDVVVLIMLLPSFLFFTTLFPHARNSNSASTWLLSAFLISSVGKFSWLHLLPISQTQLCFSSHWPDHALWFQLHCYLKKSDTKYLVNAVCMYDFSFQKSMEASFYSWAKISAVTPHSSIFLFFKAVMPIFKVHSPEPTLIFWCLLLPNTHLTKSYQNFSPWT